MVSERYPSSLWNVVRKKKKSSNKESSRALTALLEQFQSSWNEKKGIPVENPQWFHCPQYFQSSFRAAAKRQLKSQQNKGESNDKNKIPALRAVPEQFQSSFRAERIPATTTTPTKLLLSEQLRSSWRAISEQFQMQRVSVGEFSVSWQYQSSFRAVSEQLKYDSRSSQRVLFAHQWDF